MGACAFLKGGQLLRTSSDLGGDFALSGVRALLVMWLRVPKPRTRDRLDILWPTCQSRRNASIPNLFTLSILDSTFEMDRLTYKVPGP